MTTDPTFRNKTQQELYGMSGQAAPSRSVRKIAVTPEFQKAVDSGYNALTSIMANLPDQKSVDTQSRLNIDSILSGIYGVDLETADKNRNVYMYALTGNQMDDKSWMQAFSEKFTSYNRQRTMANLQNRIEETDDPEEEAMLREKLSGMVVDEAVKYKDTNDRNLFSKWFMNSASVINQSMRTSSALMLGSMAGGAIGAASGIGTAATGGSVGFLRSGAGIVDGSLKAIATKGALGTVIGKAVGMRGLSAVGGAIGTAGQAAYEMFPLASGMVAMDMDSYRDQNGKPLDKKTISTFSKIAGMGETALEFSVVTPLMNKIFHGLGITPHEVAQISWKNLFTYTGNAGFDAIHEMLGESHEEGVQAAWDEFVAQTAKYVSDKAGKTDFAKTYDVKKILTSYLNDFKDSLAPMGLVSLFDMGLNVGMGFNTSAKMKKDADSRFKREGVTIDIDSVDTSKTSPTAKDTSGQGVSMKDNAPKEKHAAINVYEDNYGVYHAVDKADEQAIRDMKRDGVEGIQVNVINTDDSRMEASENQDEIVSRIGISHEAEVSDEDPHKLVFADNDSMMSAYDDLRSSAYHIEKVDGGYSMSLVDAKGHKVDVTLVTDTDIASHAVESNDDTEKDIPLSLLNKDEALRYQEKKAVRTILEKKTTNYSKPMLREATDAIITLSSALHKPSSELAENIDFVFDNDASAADALAQEADRMGLKGKEREAFVSRTAQGWQENGNGGKLVIHVTKDADASTIIHESGHVLRKLASPEQLADFEKLYGKLGSTWMGEEKEMTNGTGLWELGGVTYATHEEALAAARANEERFADDFVRYLKDGTAPTENLKGLFRELKTFLQDLVGRFGEKLSPDTKRAFDRMFQGQGTESGTESAGQGTSRQGKVFETYEDTLKNLWDGAPPELRKRIQKEYDATEQRLVREGMFSEEGIGLYKDGVSSYYTDYGLSPEKARQVYIAVRTPAFKRWFGDWEKADNYKWLMESEPVASINKDMFSSTGKHDLDVRVNQYYAKTYNNRVYSPELGTVLLTLRDINASIAHGIGSAKAAAFAVVPEVISKGKVFSEEMNYNNTNEDRYVICAPVTIGDVPYICEVVVKNVKGSNDFYLHEVEVKTKLWNGNQGTNLHESKDSKRNANSKASRLIISKLYDSGKFFSSVVVNKKGEPRIVYHGTPNYGFMEFDASREGARDHGYYGKGFYFTPNKLLARGYTSDGYWPNGTNDGKVYGVFLNIRNPLYVNTYSLNAREDNATLKEKGYDGIVTYMPDEGKKKTQEIVAFDNKQIKSIDNRGTYDGEQGNMLFQISPALQESVDSMFPSSSGLLFELSEDEKAKYLAAWRDDTKEAINNFYFVPDKVLQQFKGEEWADREIRLRELLSQKPEWLTMAREADKIEDFIAEMKKEDGFANVSEDETDTPEYKAIEHIYNYARIRTTDERNSDFVKQYAKDKQSMIGLASLVKGYTTPILSHQTKGGSQSFGAQYRFNTRKGVSTKVKRINVNSTDAEVAEAIAIVKADPYPYRKSAEEAMRENENTAHHVYGNGDTSGGMTREEYYEDLGENAAEDLRGLEGDAQAVVSSVPESERSQKMSDIGTGKVEDQKMLDMKLKVSRKKLAERRVQVSDLKKQLKQQQDDLDGMFQQLGISASEYARLEQNSDFQQAYGEEKARQVKELRGTLSDRRARVAELRGKLTSANEDLRKTDAHAVALENRIAKSKARQARNKLKQIIKNSCLPSDSIDANIWQTLQFVNHIVNGDKVVDGMTMMDSDKTSFSVEDALNQMDYYAAQVNPEIATLMRKGTPIGDWTLQQMADLASIVSEMRRDASAALMIKRDARLSKLGNVGYAFYQEMTGKVGDLNQYGDFDMRKLTGDFHDQVPEKDANGNILHSTVGVVNNYLMKMQRLARIVDGEKEGVIYNWFVRKAYWCNAAQLSGESKRLKKGDAKLKELKLDPEKFSDEMFTYPHGATEVTLTRGQVIGLYVYLQNSIGAEKLYSDAGNGISREDAAKAVSGLSAEEKAWGDWMIDDFANNRSRIEKLFYDVYNKILGTRSRYFTFVSSEKQSDGEQDVLMGAARSKKRYTDKGMTKEINPNAIYPLQLDVTSTWKSQVRKEEHFLAWAEWTRDSNYMLGTYGGLGSMLKTKYGANTLKTFQNYVNDCGSPNTLTEDFDKLFNRVVSHGALSKLSFNLVTAIKQVPSLAAAFGQVGTAEFIDAGFRLMRNRPETLEFVYSKAPDIENRYIDLEVMRAQQDPSKNKIMRNVDEFNNKYGMWLANFVDRSVCAQLWLASYDTSIKQGMSEDEAVFKASQLVSETQNSSQITDLAEMQRSKSPFAHLSLMFTNQLFQFWNMGHDVMFYGKTKQYGKMFGTMANVLCNAAAMFLLSGTLLHRKNDDDEKRRKRILNQAASQIAELLIPVFGPMISEGVQGYSGGSIVGLPGAFGQFVSAVNSGDGKRIGKKSVSLLSELFAFSGMPTVATERAIKAAYNLDWWYLMGDVWGDNSLSGDGE